MYLNCGLKRLCITLIVFWINFGGDEKELDQLPVCVIVQLIEHCTGIAEVRVKVTVQA